MNQLNNFTAVKKENELKLLNCKNREKDYFQNLSKNVKRKTLSLFHMSLCSLTKTFDNFNRVINQLDVNFDNLAIKESGKIYQVL